MPTPPSTQPTPPDKLGRLVGLMEEGLAAIGELTDDETKTIIVELLGTIIKKLQAKGSP